MHSGRSAYRTLIQHGKQLYRSSRFDDAAAEFEEASLTHGISSAEKVEAHCLLASSLYIGGRFARAVAIFSDVYREAYNNPSLYWEAYDALHFQIGILLILHYEHSSKKELEPILAEIERGERWLEDIRHPEWGSHIILDKAEVLFRLGDLNESLDLAEKAYQMKKIGHPGWYQGTYIQKVSRYARFSGHLDRAMKVFSELNEGENDPHTLAVCLAEQIELYHFLTPPKIFDAVDIARRIVPFCNQIQSPRNRMEGYRISAHAFLFAGAWEEADSALEEVMKIAREDKTEQRHYLRRKARQSLHRCTTILKDSTSRDAIQIGKKIKGWTKEIDILLRLGETHDQE